MATTDLQYIDQGLFTVFLPVSKAGEEAWKQIAETTDGTGKVFTPQAASVVAQLKAAGYTVRKHTPKPMTKAQEDALFAELDKMGM